MSADIAWNGAILIVIGFFITVGIVGYTMTAESYELLKNRGLVIGGLFFGGFLSLIGFLAFFYGLTDYIVEELRPAGKKEKELETLPRPQMKAETPLRTQRGAVTHCVNCGAKIESGYLCRKCQEKLDRI